MRIAGGNPIPTQLLSYTPADGELVPAWLSDRDRPWLRDLLREAQAFDARPIAQLSKRWRNSVPDPRAGRRLQIAQHVLLAMLRSQARKPARSNLRQQLFALAAAGMERTAALDRIARQHELTPAQLSATLYDDLPDHRVLSWPSAGMEPSRLAWLSNLALVRGMLRHAMHAELLVHGNARAVLKTAWLMGMHVAIDTTADGATRLTWQRGEQPAQRNVLQSLLPLLPWTKRYQMQASCAIARDRGRLVVATGDAILPGPEPRLYDSKLEATFATEFAKAMPDWGLLREPRAVATSHGLAFPDFALQPPSSGADWLCEIAGLRNPKALQAKLALLSAHPRLLLCLPRGAVPEAYQCHPHVIPFDRKVPIDRIVAAVRGERDAT